MTIAAGTPGPCDEGLIRGERAARPCDRRARAWILAATILGSSLTFIDGTVVNIALPVLQRELSASVSEVQWVVEAYALFLAALLLTGGAMGDRFGRRLVFALGVAAFAIASVACGLARDVRELIVARAFQGTAAALLVPGSLAIIGASFPEKERGAAIGVWSGFSAIAAGAGPILGGYLVEALSWRWIFLFNLPLALVILAITKRHVPESRDEHAPSRLDWAGALLATVGLGLVVLGLITWNTGTRSALFIAATIGAGVAALGAFLRVEQQSSAAMMPLELFRSRTFAGANLLTLLLYAGLGGLLFFLPFNLIQVQEYSVAAAGAALLPFVVIVFLLSRFAGGLVDRVGPRLPLVVGPSLAAVGFALFALPGEDAGGYFTSFFPAILVMSLGMAVSIAPLTTTVLGAAPRDRAGIASGINNAVSRAASLLAIAVLGVILFQAFEAELRARVVELGVPPDMGAAVVARVTDLAAIPIPDAATPRDRAALQGAIAGAFVHGFRVVAFIAAALAALAAAVAAWLIQGRAGIDRTGAGVMSRQPPDVPQVPRPEDR